MQLPVVTPEQYRKITLGALVSLAFIVVTGAAVRLTGSGLGCSDWPACEDDRLVAPLEYHAMVEFVNRTITGFVSVAVILAVLGSLLRSPRRRDLTWWSLGLVIGVIAQIILGGLLVRSHLAKPFLMGHFLLSMVLVWNGTVLWKRAAWPDGAASRPRCTRELLWLSRLAAAAAVLVLATGTIVTGSGPHGGDPDVRPLDLFVPDVARIHGIAVILFGALVVVIAVTARRGDASPAVQHSARQLILLLAAQAAVGYTQYLTGVPVVLVGVHVAGATAVWIAMVAFHLDLREPVLDNQSGTVDADPRVLAQSLT